MEKIKPHYPLRKIKELINEEHYFITLAARKTALMNFGLVSHSEILDEVHIITTKDFFMSMTSLYNPKIWQDVYHKLIEGKMAYIKLQIFEENSVIISFKAKE